MTTNKLIVAIPVYKKEYLDDLLASILVAYRSTKHSGKLRITFFPNGEHRLEILEKLWLFVGKLNKVENEVGFELDLRVNTTLYEYDPKEGCIGIMKQHIFDSLIHELNEDDFCSIFDGDDIFSENAFNYYMQGIRMKQDVIHYGLNTFNGTEKIMFGENRIKIDTTYSAGFDNTTQDMFPSWIPASIYRKKIIEKIRLPEISRSEDILFHIKIYRELDIQPVFFREKRLGWVRKDTGSITRGGDVSPEKYSVDRHIQIAILYLGGNIKILDFRDIANIEDILLSLQHYISLRTVKGELPILVLSQTVFNVCPLIPTHCYYFIDEQ